MMCHFASIWFDSIWFQTPPILLLLLNWILPCWISLFRRESMKLKRRKIREKGIPSSFEWICFLVLLTWWNNKPKNLMTFRGKIFLSSVSAWLLQPSASLFSFYSIHSYIPYIYHLTISRFQIWLCDRAKFFSYFLLFSSLFFWSVCRTENYIIDY